MRSYRLRPVDLAESLYEYGILYLGNKWFCQHGDSTITFKDEAEVRKFLYNIDDLCYPGGGGALDNPFDTPSKVDQTLQVFKDKYGDPRADWLPLPIIEEAKNVLKDSKNLSELPFPLTIQQLKIIRVLLENTTEKCFIVSGEGGSGKSTFLNIVKQIFEYDCSSVTMQGLSNSFQFASAITSRLICSDELSADFCQTEALKTIISRQDMALNPKYGRTVTNVRLQSALMFCCNRPPQMTLDSGILRRLVYYRMDNVIKHPVLGTNSKKWSHEDLVNIVAHAFALDMTDWEKDFEKDTKELCLKFNSVYRHRNLDWYQDYVLACKSDGEVPVKKPNWLDLRRTFIKWGVKDVRLGKEDQIYNDD